MIARSIFAIAATALLALQSIRTAVVAEFAETRPDLASIWWSGHPSVLISSAMHGVARAAHDRREVPASTFFVMNEASSKDPLASRPYLVRGVQAQLVGDGNAAQSAFEAAQWRDPRSLPAAYFLADRYFRIGDGRRALNEVAALSRLAPEGTATIAPFLTAYAGSPANWPSLRPMLRANPKLADALLTSLASNIATVPAALALADPTRKAAEAPWLAPLLKTMTDARQYRQARTIWARSSRAAADELLHDPSFTDAIAPAPFNWTLTSSAVGLAERQPPGRLHIVYYGQEDGILANQLLLLGPGDYRLTMNLSRDRVGATVFTWSIWCDQTGLPLASATLEAAARGWQFKVPTNCPAQWLKLTGSAGDISKQAEVSISALKLVRVTPGA